MSNREVMQQALDALINTTAPKNWEAIDALRAALADPVLNADHLSPAWQAEAVAWGVDWGRNGDRSCVAIIKKHQDGTSEVIAIEYDTKASTSPQEQAELFTAPPQRKPLTDEEIDKITVQQWGRGFLFPAAGRAWVRAIERAHGIGKQE